MVVAIFIDLSKAFYTIGHGILLSKLPSYGIENTELAWFTDYLFGRRQFVSYDNEVSAGNPVTCGVPQGSILGPLLFLISFNDFPACLRNANVIKFADDTVIYLADNDFCVIENRVNETMNYIYEYLSENELILNTKKGKTEVMLFGTAKRLAKNERNLEVLYNNVVLNQTIQYKYLATTIDPTLQLTDNFNRSYKKASSRLRLLESLKHYLTSDACKCVYESMIVPILTYNCIVNLNLTRSKVNKLTSLDNRTKMILGQEVCPLLNRIHKHAVLVVAKCLTGKVCFSFSKYFNLVDQENNGGNQSGHVKTVLDNLYNLYG